MFPEPSIWPFLTAIATTVLFIWSIFTPWGVVYGAVPVFVDDGRLVLAEERRTKAARSCGRFAHRTLPRPNEAPAPEARYERSRARSTSARCRPARSARAA